jgi:hypothetical protein
VDTSDLIVNSGRLSNIEGQQTGGKKYKAAVDLLKSALEVLGIGSVPKVDLKFTGADSLYFRLPMSPTSPLTQQRLTSC